MIFLSLCECCSSFSVYKEAFRCCFFFVCFILSSLFSFRFIVVIFIPEAYMESYKNGTWNGIRFVVLNAIINVEEKKKTERILWYIAVLRQHVPPFYHLDMAGKVHRWMQENVFCSSFLFIILFIISIQWWLMVLTDQDWSFCFFVFFFYLIDIFQWKSLADLSGNNGKGTHKWFIENVLFRQWKIFHQIIQFQNRKLFSVRKWIFWILLNYSKASLKQIYSQHKTYT